MKSYIKNRGFFWRFLDHCQWFKDLLHFLGLIKGHRQRFHLGWVRPDRSVGDFLDFLKGRGFESGFRAWSDTGQELSLRKLKNKVFQYHLRIFKDKEVRGHYEKTPEDFPWDHFWEIGMENRREEFLEMIDEWLIHLPEDEELIYWEKKHNAGLIRKN